MSSINRKIFGAYYFFSFWFPVLFYSGIIFYVSSLSSIKVPLSEFNFDKVFHIVEYMPFGFLLGRAFGQAPINLSGKKLLLWVGGVAFLYGLSDEYHQAFVVGRDSSIIDVLADFIGGGIGGYLYPLINTKFRK